jgi:hypothetical protein
VQPRRPLSTGWVCCYVNCLQINYDTFLLASHHHIGCHDSFKSRQVFAQTHRFTTLSQIPTSRTSYRFYFGRIRASCQLLLSSCFAQTTGSCFAQSIWPLPSLLRNRTPHTYLGTERLRSGPCAVIFQTTAICLQICGRITLPCSDDIRLLRISFVTRTYRHYSE